MLYRWFFLFKMFYTHKTYFCFSIFWVNIGIIFIVLEVTYLYLLGTKVHCVLFLAMFSPQNHQLLDFWWKKKYFHKYLTKIIRKSKYLNKNSLYRMKYLDRWKRFSSDKLRDTTVCTKSPFQHSLSIYIYFKKIWYYINLVSIFVL